jgi:hypothetical protein
MIICACPPAKAGIKLRQNMILKKQHLTIHNLLAINPTKQALVSNTHELSYLQPKHVNTLTRKYIFSHPCFQFKKIFLHLFQYENIINVPYRRHDSPSPGCEVDLCARESKMFVR